MNHARGLELARGALYRRFGREPFDGEVRALAGVACLESGYGEGWRGPGAGSNNMGAIQCGPSWTGQRFSYFDTHPNTDGSSTKYRVDFRAYDTPEEGMLDLVQVCYVNRGRYVVRERAALGDWPGVSHHLRLTGYYEGFGATPEIRERNHLRALLRSVFSARGEESPRMKLGSLPTLRKGCHRGRPQLAEAVRLLQAEVRAVRDGLFGAVTEQLVCERQREYGLTPDGVVGPATWRVLLGDDYDPGEVAP